MRHIMNPFNTSVILASIEWKVPKERSPRHFRLWLCLILRTFLHSSRWWFGLSVEVVGEESGQDVVVRAEGIDSVRVDELSVHLFQVSTEPECDSGLFRRLQCLL